MEGANFILLFECCQSFLKPFKRAKVRTRWLTDFERERCNLCLGLRPFNDFGRQFLLPRQVRVTVCFKKFVSVLLEDCFWAFRKGFLKHSQGFCDVRLCVQYRVTLVVEYLFKVRAIVLIRLLGLISL